MLPTSGTHMLLKGGFRWPGGPNFFRSYGQYGRRSRSRSRSPGRHSSKRHQRRHSVGQQGSQRGHSNLRRRNSDSYLTRL